MKKARQKPRFLELLTEIQFCNDGTITLNILLVKVAEQTTAMADHLQKTTAGMIILFVLLKMFRQVCNASCKNSNLDFRGTRVALMNCILCDDFRFCLLC